METIVRKCVWVVCMVGGVGAGVGVGCVCMVHMFFDMNRYMQYTRQKLQCTHFFFPFSSLNVYSPCVCGS